MLTYKTFLGAASACAIALAAAPAAAADFDIADGPTFTVAAPAGGEAVFSSSGDPFDGPVDATIGRTGVAAGTFTDRFIFRLGQMGLGSGAVTTSAASLFGATDLDFNSASFDNGSNIFNFAIGPNGMVESFGSGGIPIFAGATNILTVNYTSRGSGAFGGQLSFEPNAVPEPATWALMLLGFGGIGMAMRRRRKETVRVKYAF